MTDEQLQLEVTYWQPGDGHGTPYRRVDCPPSRRIPPLFVTPDEDLPSDADDLKP